ncbi:cobalt-precorrin-6A reductase [Stappia sp. F7233]|uniref:Cobalt-precorrin-6A reductase n=1 Tax=Stappia albiluteola TaxID=2758565 RepID=A0A839AAH8_9HYPH|nr:cobalt-precorrin-6A reductase [Stappia albiluteola]MBA5775942.1 cobalt-precorrin-6A reductase [Stappia albiluteola]
MAERRVLVLAGTLEARRLIARLARMQSFDVIASLAGAVANPGALGVETRIGGFGGADGLADYLARQRIDALVDATHPYAATISANAVRAAELAKVPLIRLERPEWVREPGDNWTVVRDLREAANGLPAGAHAFLSVGRKEISAFAGRRDIRCLMRMIDPPEEGTPLPPGELLLARPSPDEDEERDLMIAHGITHLVAKNSGGSASYAKVAAARRLRLPVIMVARPPLPEARLAESEDAVLDWLADRFRKNCPNDSR